MPGNRRGPRLGPARVPRAAVGCRRAQLSRPPLRARRRWLQASGRLAASGHGLRRHPRSSTPGWLVGRSRHHRAAGPRPDDSGRGAGGARHPRRRPGSAPAGPAPRGPSRPRTRRRGPAHARPRRRHPRLHRHLGCRPGRGSGRGPGGRADGGQSSGHRSRAAQLATADRHAAGDTLRNTARRGDSRGHAGRTIRPPVIGAGTPVVPGKEIGRPRAGAGGEDRRRLRPRWSRRASRPSSAVSTGSGRRSADRVHQRRIEPPAAADDDPRAAGAPSRPAGQRQPPPRRRRSGSRRRPPATGRDAVRGRNRTGPATWVHGCGNRGAPDRRPARASCDPPGPRQRAVLVATRRPCGPAPSRSIMPLAGPVSKASSSPSGADQGDVGDAAEVEHRDRRRAAPSSAPGRRDRPAPAARPARRPPRRP